MKTKVTLRDGRTFNLCKRKKGPASPYYIRLTVSGKRTWHSLGTANVQEAARRGAEELKASTAGSDRWAEYRAAVAQRATLTVRSLAGPYLEAGCPDRDGQPRTGRSLTNVSVFLRKALPWWGSRSVAGLKPADVALYADFRHRAPRACQLEVNALNNVFRWAIRRGKLHANPLAGAPRIPRKVRHCCHDMPESDEELHRLCRYLLSRRRSAPFGAALMFQALTGLRPGEVGALRWDAVGRGPGARSVTTVEGQRVEWMHVKRCKGGINPAIRMRPLLDAFLRAWRGYTAAHWPANPWMFPHPQAHRLCPAIKEGNSQASRLSRWLNHAVRELGIPGRRRPHAMRAFYVMVRRSQGVLDALIASELGERSGERLIVSSYGDPETIRGDGRLDWLPQYGEPAWTVLASDALATPTTLISGDPFPQQQWLAF